MHVSLAWFVPIILALGCAVEVTDDAGQDLETVDGGEPEPSMGTGGTVASGGFTASGGAGGVPSTGGMPVTGGVTSTGGAMATGGGTATGGTGGLMATGGAPPVFPPPVDVTTLPPSPNNPAECPAIAPENPVGDCLGLPIYVNCVWANDQRTYSCVCDWYHWLCL